MKIRTILMKAMVKMTVVIKDVKLRIVFKKDWEECSCLDTIKLIRAIKMIVAGMMRNCAWLASCLSPQGRE